MNHSRRLPDTAQAELDPTRPAAERGRLVIDIGRILLLAAGYFLTARISMYLSGMPAHISFVWLPAGLALAALLVGGLRLAPGIIVGAFAAQYSVGGSAWMCAVVALGSTLSAVAGTWLLQRKLAFARTLDHPRHVLSVIAVGAFLSPVIAATFGATGTYWGHQDPKQEWGSLWAMWWVGDALGVLLLAPVLLCLIGRREVPLALRPMNLALVALQLLVGGYVLALHSGPSAGAYVYLSVALLTAMHLPLTWVTLNGLLTFCAAAGGTLLGSGPFAAAALPDSLVSLQTYGIVSSLATLLVSSLAQQRESVAAELSERLARFQQLITLQQRAEREIAETKRFLDALIAAIPTPVLVKDEQHRYIGVNASFCQFFRNPAEQILGKTDFDFFAPEDAAFYQQTDDEALSGNAPLAYERPYTIGDDIRWMLVRKSALTRPDGSRVVVLVLIDVTERRAAEQQLRDSETRFRALTQLSSDWYWEQDEQFRFRPIAGAPGHPIVAQLQEHIGRVLRDLLAHSAPETQWAEHRARLHAHLSFHELELACRLPDEAIVHMSLNGEPMVDAGGRFCGYRGTATDITERKLAQQRIARLKDMYAAMSEANGVIVHTRSQEELFTAICRIAVEYAHFVFVRIALVDAKTGLAETVASAGEDKGYARRLVVSTDPRTIEGQGISSDALRNGRNVICNDVLAEPRTEPWREMLTDLGVRSIATFLLRCQGKVVGTLHLYAEPSGFFDDELVALLDKLAMNLSFALDNFQRERARRAAEAALRESETRFRDFSAAAGEYVWEADLDGRFTYVSSRVQSVWGYSDQELTGRTPAELMPPGEAERVREWLRHNMRSDGSFSDLEHTIVDRHGETRWVLINAVGMFDAGGKRVGQRGTGRDITDRKAAEARISHLATRDPLTELPNRMLFNDRLEQGILAARRTGQSLALLFIDLDRFKNINDSLGHQVGDLLLKEVANRMEGCIRKGDTLSRLGGDEFVVTLEGLQQAEDAAQVAAKIIKALSRPCEIAGHTLNTSCSIGISIYPLDADDDRALMKNADTAMYHAKEKGRNNYQFFSPEMNVRAVERHTLETALRAALERQEFTLYYQPLVDTRSGKIVGMEALLRWHHPQRGVLSPATFIAVAEESGLIEPIGQWVLRTACQRAKAWQDNGYPALKVAVNISPRELIRPREFARGISRILSSTGLNPRYLELEMTERLLVQNADENIAVLRKLGQEGVRIAVDDFGTGYSSLSYLRQLPVDTIKIDRSFVRDVERDPEDRAIIEAIVAMAHSLGLQVTAEGVETRGQLDALARLGCDEYQGHLFSRALPAVEIAARFLAPGELNFEPTEAG